jgi:type VI secretion system secreted protein Hcp
MSGCTSNSSAALRKIVTPKSSIGRVAVVCGSTIAAPLRAEIAPGPRTVVVMPNIQGCRGIQRSRRGRLSRQEEAMGSLHLSRRDALRIGSAGLAVLALVPGSLVPAGAAIDSYLVFDGGAVQGKAPENGIEIVSWSMGASQSGTQSSGGGGAGKVRFSDLTITRKIDSASPKLAIFCASGQHFPKLRLMAPGKTMTFDDVIIDSVRKGGTNDTPTETLTLSYAKIETPYQPATPVLEHPGIAPLVVPSKKP